MTKRNLFLELEQSLQEIQDHQNGKLTLKTFSVKDKKPLSIKPYEITRIRHTLKMSRGVFASLINVPVRTLEKWEQGRSSPNGLAITLLKLVEQYPETLNQIAKLD